jgi:crotonobetainyl-CoA:carnitine CoA-transferase CaiB-like acyl-CoA transferase
LAVLNEAKQGPLLFEAIGRADLLDDPRFASQEARRTNSVALTRELDAVFATQDWSYWRERLDVLGITYGQAAKMPDLIGDAQMRHAGAVVPGGEGFGGDWAVGTPVLVKGEEKRPPGPAPAIGEHNAEVLATLGYTEDEIAHLSKIGVLK